MDFHPPSSPVVVRDRVSEISMVLHLAAEIIQGAYRRFKACKSDVKFRRINSVDKMVANMAADTIKMSIKRYLGF